MSETKKLLRASSHESHLIMTIVSILVPIVGLISGAIYLTKEDQLDRKFGEHLVATSLLTVVIVGALWYAVILIRS